MRRKTSRVVGNFDDMHYVQWLRVSFEQSTFSNVLSPLGICLPTDLILLNYMGNKHNSIDDDLLIIFTG